MMDKQPVVWPFVSQGQTGFTCIGLSGSQVQVLKLNISDVLWLCLCGVLAIFMECQFIGDRSISTDAFVDNRHPSCVDPLWLLQTARWRSNTVLRKRASQQINVWKKISSRMTKHHLRLNVLGMQRQNTFKALRRCKTVDTRAEEWHKASFFFFFNLQAFILFLAWLFCGWTCVCFCHRAKKLPLSIKTKLCIAGCLEIHSSVTIFLTPHRRVPQHRRAWYNPFAEFQNSICGFSPTPGQVKR